MRVEAKLHITYLEEALRKRNAMVDHTNLRPPQRQQQPQAEETGGDVQMVDVQPQVFQRQEQVQQRQLWMQQEEQQADEVTEVGGDVVMDELLQERAEQQAGAEAAADALTCAVDERTWVCEVKRQTTSEVRSVAQLQQLVMWSVSFHRSIAVGSTDVV